MIDNGGISFLNRVADDFPSATSFAAGCPSRWVLGRLDSQKASDACAHFEVSYGISAMQYGPTEGVIRELISEQLGLDKALEVSPDRVLVTAGSQEALSLCLPILCPEPSDVALMCNPTYLGAIEAANGTRVPVYPLSKDAHSVAEGIVGAADFLRETGRNARVLYLIPTFDNPTGRELDNEERIAILSTCASLGIVVLEDDAYSMLRYDGSAKAPMATLDPFGCVIHLESYSKTIAPGLRVGAIVMPHTLFGSPHDATRLMARLVQRKASLSLNTSQWGQAVVGGLLLQEKGTLLQWLKPVLNHYKSGRDSMLHALEFSMGGLSKSISWSRPCGGFFVALALPFKFDQSSLLECASKFSVIVTPMNLFSLDGSEQLRVRLSFSGAIHDDIEPAITRFAVFVRERLNSMNISAEHTPHVSKG